MLSAYQLSQRVQELRIHSWALQREGLEFPEGIEQLTGCDKIRALAQAVLGYDLQQSGFSYTLEFDWDHYMFRIELPTVAELVDQACTQKIDFASTYFPPPRRERPTVHLYMYDLGLWRMDQQVDELRKDLAVYQELKAVLKKMAAQPEDTQADHLEQEFTRNLRWNRHVRQARTQLSIQRSQIHEMIATYAPEIRESETPIRVEVTEGQSLEEAIFLALHTPNA